MVVTQANELATAAYSMTLREKRLVMLVASVIRKDDEHMKRYSFPAADVMKFLGLENNNNGYNELRSVTGDLLSRVVDISRPKPNGAIASFSGWRRRATSPKKTAKPDRRCWNCRPTARCALSCSNLKNTFRASPSPRSPACRAFTRSESSRFCGRKATSLGAETVKISLEELKKMLKVDKNYPNFGDFRRYVIGKGPQ